MCIVFFTVSHVGFKLILAANRDEFLDRPATTADWHNFDSACTDKWVLSGRDLGSPDKGTWLGITKDLRAGIITNIRYPITPTPPNAPSRGVLLKAYLETPAASASSLSDHLSCIEPDHYAGFNLLLFDLQKTADGWNPTQVEYISNRPEPTVLQLDSSEGCRGMSNSPLAEPYPKVIEGEKQMTEALNEWTRNRGNEDDLVNRMMELLSPAPTVHSPDDMTRATRVQPFAIDSAVATDLSNVRAGTRWYGTRVSTVILVKDSGEVLFVERDIAVLEGGQPRPGNNNNERKVRFQAELS